MSSRALHSPDTTKLPDMSLSPRLFVISSDSPVSSDSLTWISPADTTASAHIWFPALKMTISSSTSSSEFTFLTFPSLTTLAWGAFSMLIFSSTFLERTSCTIPIRVLMMTTGRKVRLRKDPTRQSSTPSTIKIRLK